MVPNSYFDEGTPLCRGKYFRSDGDKLFTCGLWFLLSRAGIFAELRSVNCFWKTAALERVVGRGRNRSLLVNANLYSTFSLASCVANKRAPCLVCPITLRNVSPLAFL